MERFGCGNSRIMRVELGAASAAASGTGGNESGFGAFGNEPSLEVSQCREDVKDEFAAGGRGVDGPVTNRPKADAATLQLINQGNQMPNRSPKSIETPHQQRVAFAKLSQAGFQPPSILLRPRCLVGEDQVFRNSMFFQSVKLEPQVLLGS